MFAINPQLSIVPAENSGVTLLFTDGYGRPQLAFELTEVEAGRLCDYVQAVLPIDVEVLSSEPAEEAIDWHSLTKTELIDKVYTLYGVELDDRTLKADLIDQAIALEEKA